MDNSGKSQARERFESGRTIVAVAIGAAFAACVGIACASLQGELVTKAMFSLVGAMPLLGVHFMVTSPGHESSYKVSVMMKAMPVLGILCLITGLSFLFEHAVRGSGLFFGGLSFLCTYVCVQAQDRARKVASISRSDTDERHQAV